MIPNAGCVKPVIEQLHTLFLIVLNFFKKNTNDNMTGWESLCIEIFVERKTLMFPRNGMNRNLVQKMGLLKFSGILRLKRTTWSNIEDQTWLS